MTMSKRPAATSSSSSRSRSTVATRSEEESADARLRKQRAHFFLKPLDTGPDGNNQFTAWQFGHSAGCGMAKPQ